MKKLTLIVLIVLISCIAFGFSDNLYRQLKRGADNLVGRRYDFSGKVLQWLEGEGFDVYMIYISSYYGYTDQLIRLAVLSEASVEKFIDGDKITIKQAQYNDNYKYITVRGDEYIVPYFIADYKTEGFLTWGSTYGGNQKTETVSPPSKEEEEEEKEEEKKPSVPVPVTRYTPELVLVKGGSFQMGNTRNDAEGRDDEKPVHSVKFTYDYYIGRYEVTFDEYDAYCDEPGASMPDASGWGRGDKPVINVSWEEAIEYCNWLSENELLAKAYDSKGNLLDKNGNKTEDITQVEGYRLPTEAEWEYAARGGHKSRGDYKYSGSNNIDAVSWYKDNSNRETHEVGRKSSNELGLYDMSGNVWEWCQDAYDEEFYDDSPRDDPVNLGDFYYHAVRGGSWRNSAGFSRVPYRFGYHYSDGYNYIGFRIARTK